MSFPIQPQFQRSDINLDGLLAYVSRNSITFIELENEMPSFRDSPSEDIHKGEVTAISFSREKRNHHLLASASRDKTVKIWDTTNISKGKLICKQTLQWNAEIVSIDWQLKKSKDTLFVLDNKGVLIVWRLDENSHFIVNTIVASRAILLSACPYNRYLVALGYQGGVIHIYHSKRNCVGTILEGHVEDILSLSWPPHFPSSDNITKDWSNTLDIASTSKDGTIRVWNIETKRCLVLEKPPRSKVSNSKDDYLIASWDPRSLCEIFCSSSNGELYHMIVKGAGRLTKWKKFDTTTNGKHSDYIYSVSTFSRTICTFSNDQMIFIWNSIKLSSVVGISAEVELIVKAEDIETPRSEPDILDHQRPELVHHNSTELIRHEKHQDHSNNWADSNIRKSRFDSNSWQGLKEPKPRSSWRDSEEKKFRSSSRESKERKPRSSSRDSKEWKPRSSSRDSKEWKPQSSSRDSKEWKPRSSSRDSKERKPQSSWTASSWNQESKNKYQNRNESPWNENLLIEEESDWGEAVTYVTPITDLDISLGENREVETDKDNSDPLKRPSVKEDFQRDFMKQTESTQGVNSFEVLEGKTAQTTTLTNLPDLLDLRPSSRSSCHDESIKLENEEKCLNSSDCELSLKGAKSSSEKQLSGKEAVDVENVQKIQTGSESKEINLTPNKSCDSNNAQNSQNFETGSESKEINLTPNKSCDSNNVQNRPKSLKKESSPTKALTIVNDQILLLKLSCRKCAEQKLVEVTLGVASQCVWKAMEARRWEVVDDLVKEQRELNVIEEHKLNALMLLSYLHKKMMECFDNDKELPTAKSLIVYYETANIWINRKFDGESFLKFVSEQWETMVPNLTDVRDDMYATIKKLYSQSNKNCYVTDEIYCKFAVDLSLCLLSSCENAKLIHINSVFVTAYHSQETGPTLNQICRLLSPNIFALVEDENVKECECSLAKIAKLARSESGPGASCCAFFMFNVLNQLSCEIKNVNEPLLDHSHFVFNAKPLQSIVYETECKYFISKVESLFYIILEGIVTENSSQKANNNEVGIYPVRSRSLDEIQRVLRELRDRISCFSAKSDIMQIESKILKRYC